MRSALTSRILVASLGVSAVLAAVAWVAAAKPTLPNSPGSGSATEVAAKETDTPCDMSSCDMPDCAQACPERAAPAETAPVATAETTPEVTRTPGMVAFLDPETGEIGGMPPGGVDEGTAAQDGIVIEPTDAMASDGSPMRIMNGTGEEYAVIRFDARGHRRMACGPDAKALLAAPLPTPTPEEK